MESVSVEMCDSVTDACPVSVGVVAIKELVILVLIKSHADDELAEATDGATLKGGEAVHH